MRSLQHSWLFLVLFLVSSTTLDHISIQGKCLDDQKALLLQLNHSLISESIPQYELDYELEFWNFTYSSKRSSWSLSTDCCTTWDGITCDGAGHVISLDLSSENLNGGLNNSSSLFNLQYLERLNLAENCFYTPIPSRLDQLLNLNYLNVSNSCFYGKIPVGISHMTRLVTLDLSYSDPELPLILIDPDLETLIRNLTRLEILLLDGVRRISGEWCHALSSSLPKLRVLSLSGCSLSGPLDPSLLQLQSLNKLHLSRNNISTEIPHFLGEFPNLTSLDLSSCELHGNFPQTLLKIRTLRKLDLSYNDRLEGSLEEFLEDGLLQKIVLSYTSLSGELPNSIGNLRVLSSLDLRNCRFNGSVPSSLSKLNQLQFLRLSNNSFTGLVPSFSKLNQLQYLDLSDNSFTGLISSFSAYESLEIINLSNNFLAGLAPFKWNVLVKLYSLNLRNNSIKGTIPMDLFTLPSLQCLDLSMNHFTGHLSEFIDGSSSLLRYLDLSMNYLQGHIPVSIFGMSKLVILKLFSNSFSGIANPNSLRNLKDPIFFKDRSSLNYLDISNNQIHQRIPNWIWKIGGNGTLKHLNLSYNFFKDPDRPFPMNSFKSLDVLDLKSNMLQGKNPLLPHAAMVMDYSLNNFTSVIPNISSYLSLVRFLSLSSNQINGEIPKSICEASNLEFLDLSHNNLSGPILPCLGSIGRLAILNLRGNNLSGTIPHVWGLQEGIPGEIMPEDPYICNLVTLDLNENKLEGQLPRSLSNCIMLEVLDVGHNQLTGELPFWAGSLPHLHILVLRSNRFSGQWGENKTECKFPLLQIIDISYNNFSGILPKECFSSWKAMMMVNEKKGERNQSNQILVFEFNNGTFNNYKQTVTVTSKGIEMELSKILTIFTSIDLSNNNFNGEIPEIIGNLTALRGLNLSSNGFTGPISATIGNLTQLESLDLSQNKLTGVIPFQLAGISSLSVMNLSGNKLVGKIPSGSQFQTFQTSSFQGNDGLCGFPLSESCNTISESPSEDENKFDWVLFGVSLLGFVLGASLVIGPQYFSKNGREWANDRINKILNIS